jgi:hypothetical protein
VRRSNDRVESLLIRGQASLGNEAVQTSEEHVVPPLRDRGDQRPAAETNLTSDMGV